MKFAWARWAILNRQFGYFYLHTSSRDGWIGDGRTAVERICLGVLLGLLGRGIRVGVGDAGLLAAVPGEEAVQGVDEEGRGGGGDDVSAGVLVILQPR